MMAYILAAIPLFFLLMFIEIVVDKKRGTGFYQFNDAINSLQLGMLSRVTSVVKALVPFSAYLYLYDNWRLTSLPDNSVWVWILAFVAYDLVYYWVHRLSHRINVMWGSHVVHHSSEEYNLTTALRQTSTPALFAWVIALPLAIAGVSPMLLVACASLNLIYQFWVHTRHIDKMPPWFEAVFVTPSHHRVHHALNREYIDKNFAGVFILWDKLFSSFQQEDPQIKTVYGVSLQLNSWDPIWANFQVYSNLCKDSLATRNWGDKLRVWLKPPAWRPDDVKKSHPRAYATSKKLNKFDVSLSAAQMGYVLLQHVGAVVLTLWLLLSLDSIPLTIMLLSCVFLILTVLVIGHLQQKRKWASTAEMIRLVVLMGTLLFYSLQTGQVLVLVISVLYAVISGIAWLFAYGPGTLLLVSKESG